ncbi:NUDIX hydrolase [Blastococcus sp. Marseille-P5729]|uniref:NUDIX hydrolase n=1 Tax=Blastococcus sp. Marseille-P5729 TaxID=2086582 RepID=UPI000D0F9A33|nr:NUDIX hydrolase [Blastococcus sp. Marseille-P5729]
MVWLIVGVLVLAALAVWVTWTAGRIDRLGARCEAAWQSLDAALLRRAASLRDALDEYPTHRPVGGEIIHRALDADRDQRAAAENAVSALIARLPIINDALAEACTRVRVARTFYNDAVRASAALRSQRVPRMLGLGRSIPLPCYFDIDDEPGAAGY